MVERVTHVAVDPELANPASSRGVMHSRAGHCLWEFSGGEWHLRKDACKEGYRPSEPPATPGLFEGQLRSLIAVPADAPQLSAI